MEDVLSLSAIEQAGLVRSGQVTSVELVEACLARIDELEGDLNAWVTVSAEEALAAAAGPLFGPFAGVPVGVKDLAPTAGIRTTYSSRAFARHVPGEDANVVARLRRAGFVILGKTNTPELGARAVTESELNGVCANPWDPRLTPGGSSGGSAAAVASGMVAVAHGSDGGGSIRIPASCCGLVGLKPSRGRISLAPRIGEALEGFVTDGVLTRTVADTAALLDVLSGYETGDPYWAPPPERLFVEEVGRPPGRLRIAWTVEPPIDVEVDSGCRAAAEEAVALLHELGHEVVKATPPWRDEAFASLFTIVWQAGTAAFPVDAGLLEPLNGALVRAAAGVSSAEYVRAVGELHRYARRVVAFWDGCDAVLTPTLALPPVPVGWGTEPADPWEQFARGWRFTGFTQVANVTGQPAVSLPLSWSADGIPLGIQLIGRPAADAPLLRLAAQLEEARPWRDRRPPGLQP